MIDKIPIGSMRKNTAFICQVTDDALKVIKYVTTPGRQSEIRGLDIQPLSLNRDNVEIIQKLNKVFKKLGYANNPITVSLPRNQGTCQYLRVPSTALEEIERISRLQAPRYLPYQAEELVTAYQVISTDKEGYSNINLVIAPRELIGNYLKIFNEFKPPKISIVLSSYGLCSLYNYVRVQESDPVMVVDIDSVCTELAIVSGRKMLFSRAFKLNRLEPDWERLFADEINKTKSAYLKEVSKEAPNKILILGGSNISRQSLKILNQQTDLAVEVLSYAEDNKSLESIRQDILDSKFSCANIIGLGMADIAESLNLIPEGIKEKEMKKSRHREILRMISFILATVFIFTLGIVKNLDSKSQYLKKLNAQLAANGKEAKPLEDIEKRFKILQNRAQRKPTALDIIYELHRKTPNPITLSNFVYGDAQVVLRGQAPDLNPVFTFVSELEKSPLFKNFQIKIKYMTKIKTQAGQVIDFEITALKNK